LVQEHLPTIGRTAQRAPNQMETPHGNAYAHIRPLRPGGHHHGGNGGIGLGIAQALAAAGCNVSIWGRNAEKNKSAAATMAGCSGKVHTGVCDVSDPASVKSAMAAALETFGRVDGCFANAGIGGGGRHAFIDRTEEQWRTMFATNLDGVFHVFQAAARHMTERAAAGDAFGRLIATSSLASLFGTRARALCRDQGRDQCDGPRASASTLAASGSHRPTPSCRLIKSDMTPFMANEKFVGAVMPRIPMRRFGEPRISGGIAGVPDEQGVVLSHRRLLCDRWRLYGVLILFCVMAGLSGHTHVFAAARKVRRGCRGIALIAALVAA